MSINPITVTKLKTFVVLGHSNADGWGAFDYLLQSPYQHMAPASGLNWKTDQANAYWKNVYVATSSQPFPGANHTPFTSAVSEVRWLEMTVANPREPSDPHPHASPWNFPNVRGSCYPRWFYNSWPQTGFTYWNDSPGSHNGTLHGVEIPLSWHWKHFWQDQIGIVKVAFSSSYLMALEAGPSSTVWIDPPFAPGGEPVSAATPTDPLYVRSAADGAEGYYAYWTPADEFDWAPATKRLYNMWHDKMTGAANNLPVGCQMDVQLVLSWFGDNEAAGRSRAALETSFKQACLNFIKRIRYDLVFHNWTTLPEHQIPIVWPRVHPGYNQVVGDWSSVDFCNSVLEEIAADDPFVRLVDSSTWTTMLEDKYDAFADIPAAINHFSHTGYVEAALDVFNAWLDMRVEPFDAIAEEDRVTVAEIKSRVRTYYNRARSQTDATDDTLLIHINGALNSILNSVGDNAYWLRRREVMDLAVGHNNITTMPKYVARVLKIEDPNNIKEPLQYQLLGFGEGGKCQIHMLESASGVYTVHFITRPKDVSRDDELVPLPRQLVEWLVVEVTRRLARSSSNVALQASLEGESRELRDRCIKELQVQQRAKRDAMHTVRRWPNLRYGNRGRRWGNESSH